MVQVDIPAAFTIGQLLAMMAKKYLRSEDHLFLHRLTGLVNLYISCGFVPIGLYLLVGWPAWEVMYVSDWAEKTFDNPPVAVFYVAFVVAMILLCNVGFVLAHICYRRSKDRIVTITTLIGAAATLLPFVLKWGVWMKIGSYATITSGGGYSFFDPPFFAGYVPIMLYGLVTLVAAMAGMRAASNMVSQAVPSPQPQPHADYGAVAK